MSYEQMQASVERRKKALQPAPGTYGFEGVTVEHLKGALDKGGDTVLVKLGMKADGLPEAWLVTKSKGQVLYVGNAAYTCPPRPPEDCDD